MKKFIDKQQFINIDEIVAIKVTNPCQKGSQIDQKPFISYTQIKKKIEHPNIIKCHDAFQVGGKFYTITELCNQGDLFTKMITKGPFTQPQVKNYLNGILQGLLYLSANNIDHEEIKTSNLLIHNGQVKIAGFGLRKTSSHKFQDRKIGQFINNSSEDFTNHTNGLKTDVWAFGVLIYELLHGAGSIRQQQKERLKKGLGVQMDSCIFKVRCSQELQEVVLKCLSLSQQKNITIKDISQLSYFKKGHIKQSQVYDKQLKLCKVKSTGCIQHAKQIKIINSRSWEDGLQVPEIYVSGGKTKRREQKRSKQGLGDYQLLTEQTMSGTVSSESEKQIMQYKNTIFQRKKEIMLKDKTKGEIVINLLIASNLSETQCLYIIHYCRLLSKCIKLMRVIDYKEESKLLILKRWPLLLLSTLRTRITQQSITNPQRQCNLSAQKKSFLLRLIDQYITRYEIQFGFEQNEWLNLQWQPLTCKKIISYLQGIRERLQIQLRQSNQNKLLVNLRNYVIMAHQNSKVLEESESKGYNLQKYLNDLVGFLIMDSERMNLKSWKKIGRSQKS